MSLYRALLTLPPHKQRVWQCLIVAIIGILSKGCHDAVICPPAWTAKTKAELAARWIKEKPASDNLQASIQHGKTVCAVSRVIDGIRIVVNDEHSNICAPMPPLGHYTWLSPHNGHVCVQTTLPAQQVNVAIPEAARQAHWLHRYQRVTTCAYLYESSEHVQIGGVPLPLLKVHTYETPDELAYVFLSRSSLDAPGFETRMRAVAEEHLLLRRLDDYLHSRLAHILVALLLALVLLLPDMDRGLLGLAERAAEREGLDAAAALRLAALMRDDWLAGKPRPAIQRRMQRHARSLYWERERDRRKKRAETLRSLADEQRARRLQETAERQAREAARRISRQETTLSREITLLREVTQAETSDIGRVMESGFIEDVREALDDAKPSNDRQEQARDIQLSAIMACTRELTGLDSMSKEHLEFLAGQIRAMKRALSREAFRAFIEQFDGSYEKSYRQFFALIRARDYRRLERLLLERPEFSSSSAEISIEPENLLNGRRVLLLGGIPSLAEFYVDVLTEIGAGSVTHVPGETMSRMIASAPQVVLMFWRRCSHKMQDQARSMGVPIVYVDRVTRSAFRRSVMEALRVQAPSVR